jgi:hypothetical protein
MTIVVVIASFGYAIHVALPPPWQLQFQDERFHLLLRSVTDPSLCGFHG